MRSSPLRSLKRCNLDLTGAKDDENVGVAGIMVCTKQDRDDCVALSLCVVCCMLCVTCCV